MVTQSKRTASLLGATADIAPTKDRAPREATEPRSAAVGMAKVIHERDVAEQQLQAYRDGMLVPLDQFHEVPGRRRRLSKEAYEELKANIKQHGLTTPITVSPRDGGGYEIVSGHHRLDILRELAVDNPERFGRAPIHIDVADSKKADEKAFFANLLHSSLPDYEKYLGLEKIVASNPMEAMTEADLARYVGLPTSTVNKLMSFRDLPAAAKELLETKPGALGGNAAKQLAAATKDGMGALVIAAVRKLVEDETFEQQAAVREATKSAATSNKGNKPDWQPITVGRRVYCKVLATGKTLRVDFASEAEREAIEGVLMDLLKKMKK